MNKDEFVEAVRQSMEEAQGVVDDVCDLNTDSLVKSQLLLFVVMKLMEIREREALPLPAMLQSVRPIPIQCPYMRNLVSNSGGEKQFPHEVWSAECGATGSPCDVELGLRNYQECLHFRAQRASQDMATHG